MMRLIDLYSDYIQETMYRRRFDSSSICKETE